MNLIILDNRDFLPRDSRLITSLGILRETAVLGRKMDTWTHFGITVVGENMFTNVLPLQDMKHFSLPAFNKAFDDVVKIINNKNAEFVMNLTEKRQKLLNNITFVLQNTMKQLKELKVKKEQELLITVIAVCCDEKVEKEIGEFFRSSRDVVSKNVQIQILEIGNENFLKNSVLPEKVSIHSLPVKGLEIAMEAIFKGWLKMRSFELSLNFPNNGPEMVAKGENLLVDLFPSQTDLPNSLNITSVAYPKDLCRSLAYGKCLLLSSTNTNASNTYRWQSLCKLTQNNETVVIAKENNTLATYVLFPCDDLRMIMQPIAIDELVLPKSKPNAPGIISDDFDQLTKTIKCTDEYGFGPRADTIAFLKGDWTKNFTSNTTESNPRHKVNQSTKKINNPVQLRKAINNKLAHPALGMYSFK